MLMSSLFTPFPPVQKTGSPGWRLACLTSVFAPLLASVRLPLPHLGECRLKMLKSAASFAALEGCLCR